MGSNRARPALAIVITALLSIGIAAGGQAASATVSTQVVHISLNVERIDASHVRVSGQLTAAHDEAFCTHNRQVVITAKPGGVTQTVTTDNAGRFSTVLAVPANQALQLTAHFGGAVGGSHPNRRECRGAATTKGIGSGVRPSHPAHPVPGKPAFTG